MEKKAKTTKEEREEIEREMKENAAQRRVRRAVNPERGYGC